MNRRRIAGWLRRLANKIDPPAPRSSFMVDIIAHMIGREGFTRSGPMIGSIIDPPKDAA